ncbi:MAG: preprotein translocase subunit SecG, partial [Candidatus Sumerlaeaceae bacterium]|nr:preprotein translocase subunit SecG [Candidatus Sumerlaeaceae bacterium]
MMDILFYVFVAAYFLLCLTMVMVILAQEGKGGGLSGIAGTAAIGETFGFSGAADALRKWTRNFAITFFIMTFVLTFWGESRTKSLEAKFL